MLKMKYFVLKPHGDDIYAKASRIAMRNYSNTIVEYDPELADSLWEWANSEIPEEQQYVE